MVKMGENGIVGCYVSVVGLGSIGEKDELIPFLLKGLDKGFHLFSGRKNGGGSLEKFRNGEGLRCLDLKGLVHLFGRDEPPLDLMANPLIDHDFSNDFRGKAC